MTVAGTLGGLAYLVFFFGLVYLFAMLFTKDYR